MKSYISCLIGAAFFYTISCFGNQNDSIPIISSLNLKNIPNHTIKKVWLKVGSNTFNNPIVIPVLLAKGKPNGTVLGLTAAIHGNELNGIPIIQELFNQINIKNLKGTIVAIPGLNPVSISNNRRRFSDHVDLNRIFPGKKDGNVSQQIVYHIYSKVINLFTHHIDMHTASFGRVNSMYVRADVNNSVLKKMAELQHPDIILASKGQPSFGNTSSKTLRAAAMLNGIHSITVEYGNPQVYQSEMTKRGLQGILNLMNWLGMVQYHNSISKNTTYCSKSYWIYADKGGFLEVNVKLVDKVKKGQQIGVLKNPFGDIIKKYVAPEDGIIIGKSTNPISASGGRIVHLGIIKKE